MMLRRMLLVVAGLCASCGKVNYELDGRAGDSGASERGGQDRQGPDGLLVAKYPVDVLFMVDNSNSMEPKQAALAAAFPKFIDGLKLAKLGGKIPDLRVGVVSSDLGAGPYSFSTCERAGGDGGKLRTLPASPPPCLAIADPWISYTQGTTNLTSSGSCSPATFPTDPIEKVKVAFASLAALGTSGCGFEQPLESVRRALDPTQPINPGFLRSSALLVVIFITDEDDCSASNTQLFDPAATASFGLMNSYRCTRFGLKCNEGLDTAGTKTGCVAAGSYLYGVDDYIQFFKTLKPAGQVILGALAGPTAIVTVEATPDFVLKPSCGSGNGSAAPALRIESVITGVGNGSFFNAGLDASNTPVSVNICSLDFGPALRLLASKVTAALSL